MQVTNIVYDISQILALLVLLTILVKPLGCYMAKVYQGERSLLSPLLGPVERAIYRIIGIDKDAEMDWKQYAATMLILNFLMPAASFAVLMLQGHLPFNPQKFPGFSWDLALSTAISFVTQADWQPYTGESAASYFSQIIGLMVNQFLSAATAMAILIAFIRGLVRRTAATIGNFWVDVTRGTLYILLPISFVAALVLVSQGVIQNISPYKTVRLLEATSYQKPKLDEKGIPLKDAHGTQITETIRVKEQQLPMGPVAAMEVIKNLGTNGGGFFNASSAHPYENPTPFSNCIEILLILMIPAALTYTFGRMAGNTQQGWAIYSAMMFLLVMAVGVLYWAEYSGNPLVQKLGINGYYMEGKEVRFGLGGTALFTTATTATGCGAMNAMHDSLTPLGGMVPLMLMLLSEVVFGGVGSGLYTMLAFVVIAVFTSGLMIGRIPEFLGKKIEITEMFMSVIVVLAAEAITLVLLSIALITPAGVNSIASPGPHGLTEVFYTFASTANNNGSAFAGLNANTLFYNLTTALAMFLGRFVPAIAVLAIAVLAMAGSLVRKKYYPPNVGTLPTDRLPFIIWLIGVILIVGSLTFFPALALGPFAEHLMMLGRG
ncbi:MAG: potassium-transporting ATPase subunit KdpA [Oryzomonas sp.]|uniref:potassium-transporting ATPase subunit KdpA n=1 Tax=Oryzomonas sp. TaxID=2855186 RepID=UPI00283AED1A|nr:potassium-transporting ATPase subunit KdpA [Oryzomonas sp.]MDR3580227.1 potassium-transporting ATPase subunit KdpA [Oryzomonas sp.]